MQTSPTTRHRRKRCEASPEGGWPRQPLDAIAVALQLERKLRSRGREEGADLYGRYALHKMREIDQTVELAANQPLYTDAETNRWLAAWKLAWLRSLRPEMKRRGQPSAVNRQIKTLERGLRPRATLGVARRRGAGRPRARRVSRSSSKSGDSGSGSSEGDPGEPPGSSPSRPYVAAPGSWGPKGIAVAGRRRLRADLRRKFADIMRPAWGLA